MNWLLILWLLLIVCWTVMYCKINNTFRNFMILSQAIHYYNLNLIYEHNGLCPDEYFLDYDELMGTSVINKQYLKIFDWTYNHILPQETFELLVPYLDDAEKWFNEKYGKGSKNRQ